MCVSHLITLSLSRRCFIAREPGLLGGLSSGQLRLQKRGKIFVSCTRNRVWRLRPLPGAARSSRLPAGAGPSLLCGHSGFLSAPCSRRCLCARPGVWKRWCCWWCPLTSPGISVFPHGADSEHRKEHPALSAWTEAQRTKGRVDSGGYGQGMAGPGAAVSTSSAHFPGHLRITP